MKRAVATITVYVYGETEADLIDEGKLICRELRSTFNNTEASMEKLHSVPFGKIGHQQEIKIPR